MPQILLQKKNNYLKNEAIKHVLEYFCIWYQEGASPYKYFCISNRSFQEIYKKIIF